MPIQQIMSPFQRALEQQRHPEPGGFQAFTQTPQGQSALLAFANAALQNAQNPRTGGGVGFINALSSGLGTYNKEKERQKDLEWEKELKDFERMKMEKYPEEQKRKEEAHDWQKAVYESNAYAYRPGTIKKFKVLGPDGEVMEEDRRLISRDPVTGKEDWETMASVPAKKATSRKTPAPTSTEILMIAKGKMEKNPWGLTPEDAAAMWQELRVTNPLMQMMMGGGGGEGGLAEGVQGEEVPPGEELTDEQIEAMAKALSEESREDFIKLMKKARQ